MDVDELNEAAFVSQTEHEQAVLTKAVLAIYEPLVSTSPQARPAPFVKHGARELADAWWRQELLEGELRLERDEHVRYCSDGLHNLSSGMSCVFLLLFVIYRDTRPIMYDLKPPPRRVPCRQPWTPGGRG